ncbi:MAG: iron ABC transporter permease [Chloroflexi bacterium]|nr:iron ABC transporter permease [Chloroflexota bacterium]
MQAAGLRHRFSFLAGWHGARLTGPPLLVLVPAALVAGLLLLPLVYLVLRASGASNEVWATLLRPRTAEILFRTVVLFVAVGGSSVLLAVPLAWLTVCTDLPMRRVVSVLASLPLVIPSYVGAFLFASALGPKGTLQQLLERPFGIQELPSLYGFPGAALSLTLLSYPYVFLTVRAALWRLDPAVEEAARSLGKTAFQTVLLVTVPLLRPAIMGGFLLVGLYVLSDFGAVSLFRYETFTWAIYLQYRAAFDRTAAAALSLVLVVLALGLLSVETSTRGAGHYARVGSGVSRMPQVVRLGRWRWPAFVFCAVVTLFSLVLPVGILAYWIVLGVQAGETLAAVWEPARNSAYVSLLAAVATVAAAVPLAVLTVRFRSRVADWLERAAYVAFALPGLVIALALVFFGAQYAPVVYQTLALLVAAYVIHFIPTALGTIRTSLLQLNISVEEAARSLGHAPFWVLVRVTLPLVWPGLVAGAALVFLLTMKELPATLLLSPLGFKTLATTIWSHAEAAFFAKTAVPTLVLLLVSSIPMAFLVSREPRWVR